MSSAKYRFLLLVLAVVSGGCGDGPTAEVGNGSVTGFAFPLDGVLNRDFFYASYVDQDSSAGIADYHCGLKTYDGHRGTDIVLPSFAKMDEGVQVRAVAAGRVQFAHDGEFDRNTSREAGRPGNFVVIRHLDGRVSVYGHLARHSVTVRTGQEVIAGWPLGRVGSSGDSYMPHLHLGIWDESETIDPFSGPCGPTLSSWSRQDAYQNTFMVIASGTSDRILDIDLLVQPPPQVDTITTADVVSMWVQLLNVRAGTLSRFELYTPQGALSWSFPFEHTRFDSLFWVWAYPPLVSVPGTWRFDYYHGTDLLASRALEVVPADQDGATKVQTGVRRPMVDGIGLEHRSEDAQTPPIELCDGCE